MVHMLRRIAKPSISNRKRQKEKAPEGASACVFREKC